MRGGQLARARRQIEGQRAYCFYAVGIYEGGCQRWLVAWSFTSNYSMSRLSKKNFFYLLSRSFENPTYNPRLSDSCVFLEI